MLRIIRSARELNFPELLCVYYESNLKCGKKICRNGTEAEQLRYGEEAFRAAIVDFLRDEGTFLAVWDQDGATRSCLRMEIYEDGLLLTCLETAPERRGEGNAKELVKQVLAWLDKHKPCVVYSHVMKTNKASLRVHQKNGFERVADFARLLDGTVTNQYFTLRR